MIVVKRKRYGFAIVIIFDLRLLNDTDSIFYFLRRKLYLESVFIDDCFIKILCSPDHES